MKLLTIVSLAMLLGCASQSAQSANQPKQGSSASARRSAPAEPGPASAEQGTGSASNRAACDRDMDCPGNEACVEHYCRKYL